MSIETDVFSTLSNYAGLVALVPAARVTPVIRRTGSILPAVVYSKISDNRVRHFGGDATLSEARIQVDCHAGSYSAMKAMQVQVRQAMQDEDRGSPFRFVLTDVSEGPDIYDEESEEHFSSTDFIVWHRNG